ncbi:MAG: EamA family transporter [Anaerolineales bacterium]|nr:EamA family transporter [Anaerolineales bacterium]
MKLKEWTAFAVLGLVWGSSFLWIKIAVAETGPFTLVAFRLLFGALGLLAVMAAQKTRLPRDRRTLLAYGFMGVFNTAAPFVLITWGEQHIDSSLASILNGTVPLFTIIFAHLWLADEKITVARLAGLALGFVGIVVLVSRDLAPGALSESLAGMGLWGQAAVLTAAISYAVAITFSRRHLRNQPPVLQAGMVLVIADALLWAAAPVAERPLNLPDTGLAWFAILWLGLLGSCAAYLLFFYLINAWGPTRASLVTYVFPVIGLVLGILFLREPADWRLLVGSLLIVGGIGVVNLKRPRPRPQPRLMESAAD